MSIESLQAELASFARERDWEKFHSIRNLTLALVGEVGELAEVIQWDGEINLEHFANSPEKAKAFNEEIADVFLYLLRLADIAGIDIEKEAKLKMFSNAKKYPVSESFGNSKKR
jgi:dCTP diphosphatase